jgi:hypothetical protein
MCVYLYNGWVPLNDWQVHFSDVFCFTVSLACLFSLARYLRHFLHYFKCSRWCLFCNPGALRGYPRTSCPQVGCRRLNLTCEDFPQFFLFDSLSTSYFVYCAGDNFRIVQLSDIHLSATIGFDFVSELVDRAVALKPGLLFPRP